MNGSWVRHDPTTEEGRRQILRAASRYLNPCRHPCTCGKPGQERHHPSYESLAIVWLCKSCHAKAHPAEFARPRDDEGRYVKKERVRTR